MSELTGMFGLIDREQLSVRVTILVSALNVFMELNSQISGHTRRSALPTATPHWAYREHST